VFFYSAHFATRPVFWKKQQIFREQKNTTIGCGFTEVQTAAYGGVFS